MKKDNHEEESHAYMDKLQEAMEEVEENKPLSKSDQQLIVKRGKIEARFTNILYSLTILLLIFPLLTLGSYLYYGFGNANNLIEVVEKTIYITKPNVSLEEMELDSNIGLFNMDLTYDLYKRVGKRDVRIGDSKVHFSLNNPSSPETNFITDIPLTEYRDEEKEIFTHPARGYRYNEQYDASIIEGLPEGAVVEAFVSLDKLYTEEELVKQFPDSVDLVWYAVDTGVEETNLSSEGDYISPIGYPAQEDSDAWSPYNQEEINSQQFMDSLYFLEKNEETAETIAEKPLALKERISYLEKNGINIYGIVVTGPKEEIMKLQENDRIKGMKVGEVRLWNWY